MANANLVKNVHVTPSMKGLARNVWKETPTPTCHFCASLIFIERFPISIYFRKVPFFISAFEINEI